MQISNIQKFNQIVEASKAKAAGNQRWLNAINKAVEGLQGAWIVTELAHCLAITTESGETYFANGSCQCKAYAQGQPCKHRAAARLIEKYNEETANQAVPPAEVYCSCCGAPSPVEYDTCPGCGTEGEWMTEDEFFDDEPTRDEIIADIKAAWSRQHLRESLADELMRRFRTNTLESLNIDFLRRILGALEAK